MCVCCVCVRVLNSAQTPLSLGVDSLGVGASSGGEWRRGHKSVTTYLGGERAIFLSMCTYMQNSTSWMKPSFCQRKIATARLTGDINSSEKKEKTKNKWDDKVPKR